LEMDGGGCGVVGEEGGGGVGAVVQSDRVNIE